jgi:hypothetical protein
VTGCSLQAIQKKRTSDWGVARFRALSSNPITTKKKGRRGREGKEGTKRKEKVNGGLLCGELFVQPQLQRWEGGPRAQIKTRLPVQ